MASFLLEAVKGIKAEMDAMGTLPAQLKRLPTILGILFAEVAGLLSLIPYAVTTMQLYKSLPDGAKIKRHGPAAARLAVTVERDVRYSEGSRTVLDVYAPVGVQSGQHGSSAPAPVIVFVHGGVWASGEKWHYAPMAVRLAQEGFVVVVPTYELYPKALVPQMVKEVSDALSWCQDHISAYGGDPSSIAFVGHSAGGHLVAMVLLCRAAAAAAVAVATNGSAAAAASASDTSSHNRNGTIGHEAVGPSPAESRSVAGNEASFSGEQQAGSTGTGWSAGTSGRASVQETASYLHGAGTSLPDVMNTVAAMSSSQSSDAGGAPGPKGDGAAAGARPLVSMGVTDTRMPAVCINMAGVYDIAKHYEFERARDVHELSMMKRAMGGPRGFASLSPTTILRAAAAARHGPAAESGHNQDEPILHADQLPRFFSSFDLAGEAIPHRAGLASSAAAAGAAAAAAAAAGAGAEATQPRTSRVNSSGAAGPDDPVSWLQDLPPIYIMSSCADHMVPWHEGAELASALHRVGAPARHLIFNHVMHSDYVMSWKPMSGPAAAAHAAARRTDSMHNSSSATSARGSQADAAAAPPLKDFARDFLKILRGQAQLWRAQVDGGVHAPSSSAPSETVNIQGRPVSASAFCGLVRSAGSVALSMPAAMLCQRQLPGRQSARSQRGFKRVNFVRPTSFAKAATSSAFRPM